MKNDKSKNIRTILLISSVFSFIISSLIIIKLGNGDMMENILINLGCTLVVDVIIILITYYKFLKNIPKNTKEQIETMLNERLGYETNNHNAVLSDLSHKKEVLSYEHKDILQKVNDINTSFEVSKATYATLNTDQKALVDSVKNLEKFSAALQDLSYKNKELEIENNKLKTEMENQNFKNELKKEFHNEISKSKNNDKER